MTEKGSEERGLVARKAWALAKEAALRQQTPHAAGGEWLNAEIERLDSELSLADHEAPGNFQRRSEHILKAFQRVLAAQTSPAAGEGHDYEKLWEEWRLKRFPAREEEWSHHWKAVAIEFASWLAEHPQPAPEGKP